MAYAAITNAEIQAGKPFTQTLATRMRDNPEAIAEGATDAPRNALKSETAEWSATTQAFPDLDSWQGVWFTMHNHNASGVTARDVTMAVSVDNGSTILDTVTLISVPLGAREISTCFLDFATGVVHGPSSSANSVSLINETFSGASTAINWIRFTTTTNLTSAILIHPNGGESAS